MFEKLAAKLQEAIDRLRGRGRIGEEDLKSALREIRRALIDADVNVEVIRSFVEGVRERALGQKVLESFTPAEVVLATVYEALKEALGGEPRQPLLKERNLWFLVGLQGSGKTTTAAKLALHYKAKGRRPLLVAADTQRPAAREQLRLLGEKVGVPVLEVMDGESPASIRRRVEERARAEVRDLVLVDTAGRLQVDEPLMAELARLKAAMSPDEVLLVLDAMTGQEALAVARAFEEKVGVTGLVLTKLDGDARGGAALSARQVVGKPIYFAGVSERPEGLEPFYPDRLAGRILGMGDVATLAERVKAAGLEAEAPKAAKELTLEDFLRQMQQLKRLGSFSEILGMIPGAGKALPKGVEVDERAFRRLEAIVLSMTPEERKDPRILNGSRRKRIARGSGTTVQEINRFIKAFEETKALMRSLEKRRSRGLMGMFRR
ncbi:signal recognition particle protein [Thermus thermamylovorans]|uniref:Signal recognition particle protein n=1 Tax=Thermus thermamylovorans TaxID=2509362 RepID=A0A4Q9B843_9DEIN|nr:signal recognition particle protein [Thermus thermamylovorans]TBH21796.1 signal recognition particle protein [Thermus thermamylovorans]